MRINPAVKERWVALLRSGKYTQGRDYLAREGQFCCLGVLCEMAVEEGVIEPANVKPSGSVSQLLVSYYDGERCELPESVARWAGFVIENDLVMTDPLIETYHTSLASMNDSGRSFKEIADIIEAEL